MDNISNHVFISSINILAPNSCQELCWAKHPLAPTLSLCILEQGAFSGQMNYKSWAQASKRPSQLTP